MRLYFFLSCFLLMLKWAHAQPICLTEPSSPEEMRQKSNISGNVNNLKKVRINFHIILRNDGTGNFTETHDNLGNPYSGYDFVREMVAWMNNSLSYNIPMHLLVGNNTPVIPKNYRFVTDAVYFHRNNNWFNYPAAGNNYPAIVVNMDSVMNVFLNWDNRHPDSATVSGQALSTNLNSNIKWTENRFYYQRYKVFIDGAGDRASVFHSTGNNLSHELGHLLGLDHTVLTPNGIKCPLNSGCGDACGDTPDATTCYNAAVAYGIPAYWAHPHQGWLYKNAPPADPYGSYPAYPAQEWPRWASNNLMDYGGMNALTPCQIGIIHGGLENGLRKYRVCEAVNINKQICQFTYPQVSYYGKNISLGNCAAGSPVILQAGGEAAVYFSESVEFYPSEILAPDDFEVFYEPVCP